MSILDNAGVEKQIQRRDGVTKVDANFLSGTATIQYDEKKVAMDDIKTFVAECGYHCQGAAVPAHVCEVSKRNGKPFAPSAEHQDHPAPKPPVPPPANQPAAKDAMGEDHAGHSAEKMPGDKAAMAEGMGHGTGESMEGMVRGMRNRFFVTLLLTIPIYLYAPMFVMLTGITLPVPFGVSKEILMFVLITPAVFYGGSVFYVGAWRALKNCVANMAVLVSLSVLAGYFFSVGATFFFKSDVFYEAIAMVLVFILLGHWLEMRARSGASKAVQALLKLAPPKGPWSGTVNQWKCRPPKSC